MTREDKWAVHGVANIWLSTKEAVESRIAHEIGEFAPPLGSRSTSSAERRSAHVKRGRF